MLSLNADQTKVSSFDSGTKSCYRAEWPGTRETYCDDRTNGLGLDEVTFEKVLPGRKTKAVFLIDETPGTRSIAEFTKDGVENYVIHMYRFSVKVNEFEKQYYFMRMKGIYIR